MLNGRKNLDSCKYSIFENMHAWDMILEMIAFDFQVEANFGIIDPI